MHRHRAALVTLNMRELDRLKVVQAVVDRELKHRHAAERLGLTVRQIERLVIRYRECGVAGLASCKPAAGNPVPEASMVTTERITMTMCQLDRMWWTANSSRGAKRHYEESESGCAAANLAYWRPNLTPLSSQNIDNGTITKEIALMDKPSIPMPA
ncbi:Helix-turn-helix domain-containing protein [Burkholderia sp. b14]|nr:Helix-turn-helix domain-containing protein [Burkholderia sp. b14]